MSKLVKNISNQNVNVIIATVALFKKIHLWNRQNIKNYCEISDTRENLRRFFEIDTESIIIASLSALERVGEMPTGTVKQTSKRMGIKLNREDKAV